MQDIQNKAIKTYLENIEFLKYNHQSLYERVSMLSTAIDNNQYKERYHLEYIKEDQEFDIFDSSNETYLYNRNPKKFIDDAVSNSNLDKVNSIDLLDPEVYNLQQPFKIDDSQTIQLKSMAKAQNDIFDFIKIFKKSTIYKNKKFKKLDKFIFVGTLLGRHIEPIAKKLNSIVLFIYEYNLEIFRLSLFTTNYAILSQTKLLIFSIMDDQNELEHHINNYLLYEINSNYMVKYYSTNYNINDFFDRVLAVASRKNPLAYSYSKIIDGLISPVCTNISKYPVLNTKETHNIINDIPILFIAAGPSFGKNIEWIKKNHKNYFIVAIGAVIIKLIENGIKPNLIVSGDADEIVINQFPLRIRDKIQDIPFLTSSSTHKELLDIFPITNIILYEMMCLIKNTSSNIEGYSIGEVTLKLITILGGNNIYMLGTDMALDQDTGASHTLDHQKLNIQDITKEKKEENHFIKNDNFNMTDSTVVVKGNFRDVVVTTTRMVRSIRAYNQNIKTMQQINPLIKIFNLNDGAYFEGTTPLQIDQITPLTNCIEKTNFSNDLLECSKIGLSQEEAISIKNSITEVNKLLKSLKRFKKIDFKSYMNFNEERKKIIKIIQQDLKKFDHLYTDKIFYKYYMTMEPYLGFQFNEVLDNETYLINQVKDVWCEHMIRLTDLYKVNMNELFNKSMEIN